MRGFGSDNHAGIVPEVLEAIAAANEGHAHSYGDDPWTARAEAVFRRHFGEQASTFIVFNGTGANVVALRALLKPYEAVICADTAHLNVDECGAPERIAGVKLLGVETADGKLVTAFFAGSSENHPDVGIWVSRLIDGKWTAPVEAANGVQVEGPRQPCWNRSPRRHSPRWASAFPLVT